MKQLIDEMNECLGKDAYAKKGITDHSIDVFPAPLIDMFKQVTIVCIVNFCRKQHLCFFIDLERKFFHLYRPVSDNPSID